MADSPHAPLPDDTANPDNAAAATHGRDPEKLAEQLLPVLVVMQKRLAHSLDQRVLSHGPPSVSQVRAVIYLSDHEAVSVSGLADALELSRPATTELVDRLVEHHMVTRTPNPADRRQVMVSLTDDARKKSAQLRGWRLERLTRVLSQLNPEERPGFVRGMLCLVDELLPDDDTPCPDTGTLIDNT